MNRPESNPLVVAAIGVCLLLVVFIVAMLTDRDTPEPAGLAPPRGMRQRTVCAKRWKPRAAQSAPRLPTPRE